MKSIVSQIDIVMLIGGDLLSSLYKLARRNGPSTERIVFHISNEDLKEMDAWGVPAGMKSRAETIRTLIKIGLQSVSNEKAEALPTA